MTHFSCLSRVNLRIADQGLAAGSGNDSNVTSDIDTDDVCASLK